MIENYTKSVRQSVPDGSSVVTEVGMKLPNNSLTCALKHLDKITENFSSLINDEDGQCLFEEYSKSNGVDNYILFWFAIEGFKRRFNELDNKSSDTNRTNFQTEVTQMAKAIYNNFIKNNAKTGVFKWFSKSTRETIYNKILNKNLDSEIFQQAKIEFEGKINEEIYPNFLKSEIFLKYSDNLKNNYDLKASKSLKNPYHTSYTNFHPTSTQDSEYQFDPKDESTTIKKENKNQINLNKIKNDKSILNKTNLDRTNFNQDRTLQFLYSTGARSHLPQKPKEDMEKVKFFFFKLRKIEQERIKQNYLEQDSNKSCDQRILRVIEKFEQNADQNSPLRKLINKDGYIVDSESILDQHCLRVFHSNYHTKSLNTPGFVSPKKLLKSNNQYENNFRYNLNYKSSTPSKLYDSYNYLTSNSSINCSNQQYRLNSNSIIIMYQYGNEIPYSIKMNSIPITLRQFKKEIIKKPIDLSRQKFKYFFKKKDKIEDTYMYIMQELNDDNELVPFCDGRVFAKIEIVSLC